MEEKILQAINELRSDFGKRLDKLENKVDIIQIQTKENTDILQALMHSAEVNRADHDKMMVDIAHLQGDVTSIKKDLSTVELITANNYADIVKLKAVK